MPDELNHYALGDCSNLTYQDGSLLYSDGEEKTPDRPFQILIQSDDVLPPKTGRAIGSFLGRAVVLSLGIVIFSSTIFEFLPDK